MNPLSSVQTQQNVEIFVYRAKLFTSFFISLIGAGSIIMGDLVLGGMAISNISSIEALLAMVVGVNVMLGGALYFIYHLDQKKSKSQLTTNPSDHSKNHASTELTVFRSTDEPKPTQSTDTHLETSATLLSPTTTGVMPVTSSHSSSSIEPPNPPREVAPPETRISTDTPEPTVAEPLHPSTVESASSPIPNPVADLRKASVGATVQLYRGYHLSISDPHKNPSCAFAQIHNDEASLKNPLAFIYAIGNSSARAQHVLVGLCDVPIDANELMTGLGTGAPESILRNYAMRVLQEKGNAVLIYNNSIRCFVMEVGERYGAIHVTRYGSPHDKEVLAAKGDNKIRFGYIGTAVVVRDLVFFGDLGAIGKFGKELSSLVIECDKESNKSPYELMMNGSGNSPSKKCEGFLASIDDKTVESLHRSLAFGIVRV